MIISFEGKVALVTGAASGLGLATAKAFAESGASVALADCDERGARAAADDLTARGHKALAIACDVSDDGQVEAMVAETVAAFGRLDAAYNNAGVQNVVAETADATRDDFDRVVAINLRGVWNCLRFELREMRKQRAGAPRPLARLLPPRRRRSRLLQRPSPARASGGQRTRQGALGRRPAPRPEMFDDTRLLVVDVETTGLDPDACSISASTDRRSARALAPPPFRTRTSQPRLAGMGCVRFRQERRLMTGAKSRLGDGGIAHKANVHPGLGERVLSGHLPPFRRLRTRRERRLRWLFSAWRMGQVEHDPPPVPDAARPRSPRLSVWDGVSPKFSR